MNRIRNVINWWRQRHGWVRWMTYLVFIVVAFYTVENGRGHLALEKAKAEYLAAGFRLDIDEILGPPIADKDNFAASEFIREIYSNKWSPPPFFGEHAIPSPVQPLSETSSQSGLPESNLSEYFIDQISVRGGCPPPLTETAKTTTRAHRTRRNAGPQKHRLESRCRPSRSE